ncbi:Cytochrome c oxidase subunit 2 precursor [Pigmentiphaga humi]|uniref:Cytochrome c oxidase subunit 2 n=1 Tax=Pigmentiphaga humi TaxID=2478468 RepID=A0A3P4B4V4_9BURK|nr:cytochrome c oxidase subunit II [Pigmentiphaga humi]VCU70546.1 Cytochrome c oxidase subunit 2 precursor [Pigmentiphaga humi]
MKKWLGGTLGAILVNAMASGAALAVNDSAGGPKVNQLNLHAPVTSIAADIEWLHWMMLGICLIIFLAVFAVMFYSIWAHRKSRGAKPATFHESIGVEIAWTVVPFLIVIGMALPATKTVVAMKDTSNADLTVKATGYQWKWGYDYLNGEGEGIAFLSNLSTPAAQMNGTEPKGDNYLIEVDNPLVVPVNKKVRVVTTANDVIHAWMVPAFGVKQDAIPGFVRDTWFRAEKVGEFRGQCAELCGKDHAFMPIVVKVVSQEDYSKWVEEQKAKLAALADDPNKTWTADELKTRGEKVFASNCVACHQANGKGVPGTFPALDGDPTVLGPKAAQIEVVLKGRPGTAMASFAHLSDTEIGAVITYTRNAWSNAGKGEDPVVQPLDVKSAR